MCSPTWCVLASLNISLPNLFQRSYRTPTGSKSAKSGDVSSKSAKSEWEGGIGVWSKSAKSKSGKGTKVSKSGDENVPTPVPSRADLIREVILDATNDPDLPALLADPTTPEAQALNWLVNDDPISPPLDPNDTSAGCASGANAIVQRFTLVALYFATGGASWNDNTGWLGSGEVCSWFGVDACDLDANSCGVLACDANSVLVLPS